MSRKQRKSKLARVTGFEAEGGPAKLPPFKPSTNVHAGDRFERLAVGDVSAIESTGLDQGDAVAGRFGRVMSAAEAELRFGPLFDDEVGSAEVDGLPSDGRRLRRRRRRSGYDPTGGLAGSQGLSAAG